MPAKLAKYLFKNITKKTELAKKNKFVILSFAILSCFAQECLGSIQTKFLYKSESAHYTNKKFLISNCILFAIFPVSLVMNLPYNVIETHKNGPRKKATQIFKLYMYV